MENPQVIQESPMHPNSNVILKDITVNGANIVRHDQYFLKVTDGKY